MIKYVVLANLSLLLSQIPSDAGLAGSAGWAGAGILGLVLSWLLLVHLPAKDKQMKDMIESRDALSKSFVETIITYTRESRSDFRTSLETITKQFERDLGGLAQAIHHDIEQLGTILREATTKR